MCAFTFTDPNRSFTWEYKDKLTVSTHVLACAYMLVRTCMCFQIYTYMNSLTRLHAINIIYTFEIFGKKSRAKHASVELSHPRIYIPVQMGSNYRISCFHACMSSTRVHLCVCANLYEYVFVCVRANLYDYVFVCVNKSLWLCLCVRIYEYVFVRVSLFPQAFSKTACRRILCSCKYMYVQAWSIHVYA